ncbi:MAG: hypothetical protein HZB26_15405 [Candidatus Hydrogenedentes bacterium]|nr:hypothetical protein [Candidatus Hydrogenedentota bacterium]
MRIWNRGIVACLTACALGWATAYAADPGAFDVTKAPYGAKADGVTDDTAAFQKAISDAGATGMGGTVFAPRGTYLIAGNLRFPPNVTLEGVWEFVPTPYKFWYAERANEKVPGTVLLATAGEGKTDGPPFISLHVNCCIKGITIFYPNQIKANPPKPYPWTIGVTEGGADHCTIRDVLLVNPYQAVDFGSSGSGRHYIENLYAYPLFKGIFIDKCYDIGRINNVHLWPFWGYSGDDDALGKFVTENAEAFIIGRTDWEYITNSFAIFYKVGFHFIKTDSGSPNVLLTQSGADICPSAVLVDDCQTHAGVSFENSQLFGRIVVRDTNTGPVRFTGCGFFGATRQKEIVEPIHLDLKGKGHVSFDNCHFITLDPQNTATINLLASGGSLSVMNCLFKDVNRTHVDLEPGVRSAVIVGNTFDGKAKIVNNSKGNVQIGLNADYEQPEEKGAIVVDDSADDGSFKTDGKWTVGTGGDDYMSLLHWASKGNGDARATWRPKLVEPGRYAVYVWFGGDPMNDHASDAPYTVHHAGGDTVTHVNLKQNAGRWVSLGEFEFVAGTEGYVMASNAANGNVVADAVKFVKK